jgi:hypothetical protein
MSALVQMHKTADPLPASVDYASKLPDDSGVMLNDRLGCCTCAALYHAIQVWSSWTNPDKLVITEPDECVLQTYEEACGYNPDDPSTDGGGIEQNVLTYYAKTGIPTGPHAETRHHLRAFVEVDVRNLDDIKRAIYECGLVYIGFAVPSTIMPEGEPIPKVWDTQLLKHPKILGGHAIILAGYDKDGFSLISWGSKYEMTYRFFRKYTDEAYALADIDWLDGMGKTLLGMSMAELKAQMSAL